MSSSLSGHKALKIIDRALHRSRRKVAELDTRVEKTGNRLVKTRQQESATYRKLAGLKIDALQADKLNQYLDRAERQALELLEQRERAVEHLANQVEASEQRQVELETARQQQSARLDTALEVLDELLETTQQQLLDDPEYQAQQKRTQKIIDMASAAGEKTEQAEADREEKGKPYREERIFQYLWERGYGTSKYRASPLVRFFDQRLARYIRYEPARRNYAMLLEIPERLREHTQQLHDQAQQEMRQLDDIERDAQERAGVVPLEENVDRERQQLAQLDMQITQEETEFANLIKQREAYATSSDPYFSQAIEVLVNSFRSEPIPQLRREAEQTYGYEDDVQVKQLAELREQKTKLERRIEETKSFHRKLESRLHELEDIRRRFKHRDYDARNSQFKKGYRLEEWLEEFVEGDMSAKSLWRALKDSQRFYKRNRTPRYGGIGLPGGVRIPTRIPGGFRVPRGVRIPGGWGGGGVKIPKMPRIPRGGGGGFKTGGGF